MSDRPLLKDLSEEIDLLDDMLESLIEILEEKNILTQKEWEDKIKRKIEKKKNLQNYRNIQFKDE